jgi:rhomboid protease GluP
LAKISGLDLWHPASAKVAYSEPACQATEHMSWNVVLFWNTVIILGLTLVRLLRDPVKAWDWVGVVASILGPTVAGWWLFPDWAGVFGAALTVLFVVLPMAMQRRIQTLIQSEQWRRAIRLAVIARLLHPLGLVARVPILVRGREAVGAGDLAGALAIFEPLAAEPGQIGLLAQFQVWRLRHEWEQAVGGMRGPGAGDATGGIVRWSLYLRALGETGRLDELVPAYQSQESMLYRPGHDLVRREARIILLGFTGASAALERLLDAAPTPPETRDFWLGTAAWLAGDLPAARARLEPLSHSANAITAEAARRRLAGPLAGRAAQLAPEIRDYLAALGRELGHERRLLPGDRGSAGRAAVATWTLLGLNVLMFAVETISGVDSAPNPGEAYYRLGAVWSIDFGWGDVWHLLAANFLHFGTAHLAFNMLALVVLGRFVERYCGVWRYLFIYLVAGVGAMGGVVLFSELGWMRPNLIVGASGAIMGLVGAQAAILWREHRMHGARIAAQQLRPVLTIVALQVVFDQLVPQVSGTAHMVGLAVGFVVTSLVLIFWPLTRADG